MSAPKMPPNSSTLQSIHLFGLCDILLKPSKAREEPSTADYLARTWSTQEIQEIKLTPSTCILNEITHLSTIIFRRVWLGRLYWIVMHFWYILAKVQHTKKVTFCTKGTHNNVQNRGAAEFRSLKQTTESQRWKFYTATWGFTQSAEVYHYTRL